MSSSSYHFVVPQQSSSTAAPQSPRLGRQGSGTHQPGSSGNQWFCDPTSSSSNSLSNFTYLRQQSRGAQSPHRTTMGTPTRTSTTPTRTFGTSGSMAPRHSNSPATPLRQGQSSTHHRPSSPGASYTQQRTTPRASTPGGSSTRAMQQQMTAGGHQLRAHTPTRASTAKLSDVPLRERQSTPTRTGGVKQHQTSTDNNIVSPYLSRLYERQLSQTRHHTPTINGSGNHSISQNLAGQQQHHGVVQAPPTLSPTLLSSNGGGGASSKTSPKSGNSYYSSNGIHSSTIRHQTPRSVDSYGSVGGLTATSSSTTGASQRTAPSSPPPPSSPLYSQQLQAQKYRESSGATAAAPRASSATRESQRDSRPSLHPSSTQYPTPTKQPNQSTRTTTPVPKTPPPLQHQSPLYYDPFGSGPNSPTTPVMPRPQLNRRVATPHTPTSRRIGGNGGLDDSLSNMSPTPSMNGSFAVGDGALTPLLCPSTPTNSGLTPTFMNASNNNHNSSFSGAKQLFTDAAPSAQSSTVNTPTATTTATGALSPTPSSTSWTRGPKATLRAFVNCWVNKYKESSKSYKEGGYCTVSKGEKLNNGRYTLLHKLGWGEFSVVWLARDAKATKVHHTFVAVKIAKCHPSVINGTKYEINLLRYITESPSCTGPMTELLESFEHTGNYGLHMCMVMPVMGSNLLCVIDQMKSRRRLRKEKELAMIKDVTMSTLKGLDALEMINVVHTDIKPENVLVAAPDPKMVNLVATCVGPDEEHLVSTFSEGDPNHPTAVIADFGLSFLLEHPSFMPPGAERVGVKKDLDIQYPGIANNKKGILIQTREYRAPEVLFGSTICCRSDVWSVGCMVYEIITGDFLMDPKKKTSNERDMDVEHLAAMMHILGPVPQHIARPASGTAPKHLSRFFDTEGRFLHPDKMRGQPRRSIATELEVFLEPAEAERAAQFIMSCFTYDPLERCHARDLLNHSWLRSALAAPL